MVVGSGAAGGGYSHREMTVQKAVLAFVAIPLATGIVLAFIYTTGLGLQDQVPTADAEEKATVAASTWGDRLERVATAGILIGGVIALGVASWRAQSADQQAKAAQKQVDTALQQVGTAQEQVASAQRQADTAYQGLLNERYQKGAEMLGSDVLAVRLAGIYALGQIADDHPERYYIQITQLLSAFVRHPTDLEAEAGEKVREDVQEAVSWIGRSRNLAMELEAKFTLELTGAYLRGAVLMNADFSFARMEGVDLRDAKMWEANLSHAHLWHAKLADAILVDADLCKAQLLKAELRRANLGGADLTDANLTRADLSGQAGSYDHDAHTLLFRADLSGTNFTGANLTAAEFPGAIFSKETSLMSANLSSADLSSGGGLEITGLTQEQIDFAYHMRPYPVSLRGTLDMDTGEELKEPPYRYPEEDDA